MAATGILSPLEVRTYINDFEEANLLVDGEEFSDTMIQLCIDLAVEDYNSLSPLSSFSPYNFPSKGLLLLGTLAKMYSGKAANLARNTMAYSDGGLTIPIEERFELYQNLAGTYGAQFSAGAAKLKISQNMSDGWGHVSSDWAFIPLY